MKRKEIIEKLEELQKQGRKKKWREGVYSIAIDRIAEIDGGTPITWHTLLNGALWKEKEATFSNISNACNNYAWGGCGLVYDCDIADLLATKSEAYYKSGNLKEKPNANEQWLDCYARAVYQAFKIIIRHFGNEIVED